MEIKVKMMPESLLNKLKIEVEYKTKAQYHILMKILQQLQVELVEPKEYQNMKNQWG